MIRRRLFSRLFVVAGIALLAAAGLHYLRGYQAQSAGRRVWEQSRAAAVPTPLLLAAASATPREDPAIAPAPATPQENPGIVPALAPPTAEPGAPPYPYGKPIARLRIPSAKMDYIVFGGDDAGTLEKGPGHVPGTELPGQDMSWKNCVITAHRDSHFRHLGWLRKGHRIELETPSGQTSYRVVSREIVNPDAVRVLQATAKPRLTLITCYPFDYIGPAPKRLVVRAEPVASRVLRGKEAETPPGHRAAPPKTQAGHPS